MKQRKRGVVAATLALLATLWLGIFVSKGPGWTEIPDTMKIRYQSTLLSSDSWGTPRLLSNEMDAIRDRLANHRGGSYRIKQLGEDWSILRNLDNTMDRLKELVRKADNREVYAVWAVVDDFKLKARKVDLNPAAYADTEGTRAVDIIVGTLRKNYPGVEARGIYVCRTISGSYSLSQHAYANAVDVFGTVQHMDEAAYGIKKMVLAGYVPASQILWNYSNILTGSYVYDHTTHIHFSGDPLMSGGCRRP